MKIFSFFRYATTSAMILAATSCSKDNFLGDNLDPNNPSTVSPGVLLSSLEAHTAFTMTNTVGRVTELFMQHYAGVLNQPSGYDTYAIRGEFDNEWQADLYAGSLADAQNIIDNGARNGPTYTGIAKLLKAYNFAFVTDLWGDVPYSQALQISSYLQPRFDKQEDIYRGNATLGIQGLFDLVRDGLKDLDQPVGAVAPGADDLIYNGKVTSWKKFGNTLLLKFALQISKKDPVLAKAVIMEVLAKGTGSYISDNADDFQLAFGSTVGNQNPFYSYNGPINNSTLATPLGNRPLDQVASTRFIDSLSLRNDPRLPQFYTNSVANALAKNTAFGLFTGFNNATGTTIPANANRSRYNTYIVGVSGEAPVRMLTNFQTKFILAEAALLLNTGEIAQNRFREGIIASMLKTGITQANIDLYVNSPANLKYVTLGGSTPEVSRRQIIAQKWIALLGNGYEAWNDYRRTGYPSLAPVDNPSPDSRVIPQRFFYTLTEISSNANNIPNPRPNITAPVWWATN